MKKSIIFLCTLTVILTMSISSCKKKTDDATKSDTTEHPSGDHDHASGDHEHPSGDK